MAVFRVPKCYAFDINQVLSSGRQSIFPIRCISLRLIHFVMIRFEYFCEPRLIGLNLTGAVLAALIASSTHATVNTAPPPGQYQIDSRTVDRWQAGPAAWVETTTETDGATGTLSVTRKTQLDKGVRTQYKGQGPIHQCVHTGMPIVNNPCSAIGATGCTATSPAQWKKIDDTHWEVTFLHTVMAQNSATSVAQARSLANNPIMANLPPEARAKMQAALAAMPDSQQLAQQDAQMAAAIEREATNPGLSAAERAAAKSAASAARGQPDMSTARQIQTTQRWTLLGPQCNR